MKLHGVLRSLFMFAALTPSANLLVAQQTCDDTVVTWNNLAIKTATTNNARGLLMVRALAIMHTAIYDAWARYDAAAGSDQGDSIWRPEAERTIPNKREAIRYAAFRVLVDLFPADSPSLDQQMLSLGKAGDRDRHLNANVSRLHVS